MELKIDGVIVTSNLDDFTEDEARNYVRYVEENKPSDDELEKIEVALCDDGKVDVIFELRGRPFERIRRITGYLAGDLARWNNAKRAEESERVKHDFRGFSYEK